MPRPVRAAWLCLALLGAWPAAPAMAQAAKDAPLAIPDVPQGIRGIRVPDEAQPAPARTASVPARAAVRPERPAVQDAVQGEAAARCILRHVPKAAGNGEIFREIRRICVAYPGIE